MSLLVGARAMLAELEGSDGIELRRGPALGRNLAAFVERLGRPPRGLELEEFLEQQPLVEELFASVDRLEELAFRHFASRFAPVELVEARHPELEAQLYEALDEPDAYQVYADWLQEQGDPLGELIALGVAASDGGDREEARFRRYLDHHKEHFLGAAAKAPPERLLLHWRYGVVHRAEASRVEQPELWRELLARPVAGFVQHIELGAYRGGAIDFHSFLGAGPELLETIADGTSRSLRSLTLHNGSCALPAALLESGLRELTLVESRRFAVPETWPPQLETLSLDVGELTTGDGRPLDEAAPAPLPIRALRLRLGDGAGRWLAALELPRLEELTLDLRRCDDPARMVRRLLGEQPLPALRALTLTDGRADGELLTTVAELALAPQLTSLALTGLSLRDPAMLTLARHRERFAALERLDISDNELTAEGVAQARQLARDVESRRQDRAGTARHATLRRFAGTRYEVAQGISDPDNKGWLAYGQHDGLLWARYRGGARYQLWVQQDLSAYRCSCPSYIQPCKHVVALLLAHEQRALPSEEPPFELRG